MLMKPSLLKNLGTRNIGSDRALMTGIEKQCNECNAQSFFKVLFFARAL
jgi:hypothetical protein